MTGDDENNKIGRRIMEETVKRNTSGFWEGSSILCGQYCVVTCRAVTWCGDMVMLW